MQSMKSVKDMMLLYAVTDRYWTGRQTLTEQVEEAIKGGVTCVQLREKELDDAEFLSEANEIKKLCKMYDVPFIVNDNVDVALKCGADGIHVGQQKRLRRTARIISALARCSQPEQSLMQMMSAMKP